MHGAEIPLLAASPALLANVPKNKKTCHVFETWQVWYGTMAPTLLRTARLREF
jgi:hypothetical protein